MAVDFTLQAIHDAEYEVLDAILARAEANEKTVTRVLDKYPAGANLSRCWRVCCAGVEYGDRDGEWLNRIAGGSRG